MIELQTKRLIVRDFTIADAPFILRIVNEPSWLRFIGNRNVHTLEDAQKFILNGPLTSYEKYGFGHYLVMDKDSGAPLGMCGLMKRDFLPDADLGYSFLPEYWGKGYATEAATLILDVAKKLFKLEKIAAIVSPDNESSIKLLKKLGFSFERMIRVPGEEKEIELYSLSLS